MPRDRLIGMNFGFVALPIVALDINRARPDAICGDLILTKFGRQASG